MKEIYRGQIYYADLSPVVGSEQGGLRPVLILQNDKGNKSSPTTVVAAITSRLYKRLYPTQVDLDPMDTGLHGASRVLCEQIRTIDKSRLKQWMGEVKEDKMALIDKAIKISLGV